MPTFNTTTIVTNKTTKVTEIIIPLLVTITPNVQNLTTVSTSTQKSKQLAQVFGIHTVETNNSTLNKKIAKRKQKINQILQKLKLRKLMQCDDKELEFAIKPLMTSYEMNYDIITKIFLPIRAKTILCKTTSALRNQNLSKAKDVLINEISDLIKTIGMNNNRLSILRIMIGIASTRAIIMYPQEHYQIRVFTNILTIKLPLPMTRNMEIKEKLTVLLAMKQLMKKLKITHWRYSIKTQKRQFKDIFQQIKNVLDATEFGDESQSMSSIDEKTMEDEISALFSEMDGSDMNMSAFTEMLEEYNLENK